MPALVAGIHVLLRGCNRKTWMAGTSPAMTEEMPSYRSAARLAFGSCPISILAAAITACVRLSTPSFCRIAETCAFTVASDTPSS